MSNEPISPTRIIPAGEPLPLPAPVSPPPPPPRPPAPPAIPPDEPDWWHRPPVPPPPLDVYVHVDVHLPGSHLPAPVEPEPGPRWYQRIRPGYTFACCLLSLPVSGPWSVALADVRDTNGLAGAWVMALGPLVVLAFADNVYRIAAAGAHPDLWAPKVRALLARTLLCAAATATALTLPVSTLVYAVTGVRP